MRLMAPDALLFDYGGTLVEEIGVDDPSRGAHLTVASWDEFVRRVLEARRS